MIYQNDESNQNHSPSLQDNEEALCQAYDYIFKYSHIMESAKLCVNGVAWKSSVQMFTVNRLQWCSCLYRQLHNNTYKSKGFCKFFIHERGKTRFIQSVHISERAVQKTLNNYGLKPIIEPKLIYDNGASRKGKGTDFAIKRLRKHLASHFRNHRKQGGILTIDFHDYFNSIPHDILLSLMQYSINDNRVYELSKYFIDAFGDTGLGLGSEISQIAAIYYPNILDHYIKERLHIKGCGRYMDDMYIINEDIQYLKYVLSEIERITKSLGLTLNTKSTITRFENGSFVFLKRRFFISDSGKIVTRLLRKNITQRRRILKRQFERYKKGKADIYSISQSYQSWRGYALKWNSKKSVYQMDNLYSELFKEVI